MSGSSRVLVAALVRIVLLAIAAWFVAAPNALGPETPMLSRIALVVLALVLSVVVGEVVQMRLHLGLLVGALRQRAGGEAATVLADVEEAMKGPGAAPADPKAAGERAVPILIQAPRGTGRDAARRAAHEHLKRLTGQDLPRRVRVAVVVGGRAARRLSHVRQRLGPQPRLRPRPPAC
ncbi:MAG: hypothetical protein R3F05_10175 [Planctomycetota bacterium]